jgi:hypothetical protein
MTRCLFCAFGLLLLLGGLGAVPVPVRGQASAAIGVMIRYPDGHIESLCVSAPPGGITGLEVLQQAGVPLRVETQSGGVTVCAMRGQGCADPSAPCFCQCQGGGDCLYWTYYHWQGGRWVVATLGASNTPARPGVVEGGGWGAPPPAPSGAALCGLAAPAASPTPPQATATPRPPAPPTRRPVPTSTRARPTPPLATSLPPTFAPSPVPAAADTPTATRQPLTPTLTPGAAPSTTPTPLLQPPTPTGTLVPVSSPTPSATAPVLIPTVPTPNPQSPPPPPDLLGLLAFAVIVAGLLGAMGWLRRRNRGL